MPTIRIGKCDDMLGILNNVVIWAVSNLLREKPSPEKLHLELSHATCMDGLEGDAW